MRYIAYKGVSKLGKIMFDLERSAGSATWHENGQMHISIYETLSYARGLTHQNHKVYSCNLAVELIYREILQQLKDLK